MMSDSTAALMRPTALHAALLANGAEIPAIPFWRAHCGTLVETLQQEMQDRSFPATDVQEVSLAQCVLLDELTLHALPSRRHEEWLRDPLQMRFHRTRDGAARVWEQIDAMAHGGYQDLARLEFYSILLALGFDGGRQDADAYLEHAKSALNMHRRDKAVIFTSDSSETATLWAASLPPRRVSRTSRIGTIAGAVVVGAIAVASIWAALHGRPEVAPRRLPETSSPHSNPVETERSQ